MSSAANSKQYKNINISTWDTRQLSIRVGFFLAQQSHCRFPEAPQPESTLCGSSITTQDPKQRAQTLGADFQFLHRNAAHNTKRSWVTLLKPLLIPGTALQSATTPQSSITATPLHIEAHSLLHKQVMNIGISTKPTVLALTNARPVPIIVCFSWNPHNLVRSAVAQMHIHDTLWRSFGFRELAYSSGRVVRYPIDILPDTRRGP
jgi:membrane peptidoglycan carboxypeptidase